MTETIYTNKFLLEATFKGEAHRHSHYIKHVLQPGEVFDSDDPKFNFMTEQEYYNAAQELSEAPAKIINSEEELSKARGIIGWVSDASGWRHPRCIKIDTYSKYKPGYIAIVAYVDDAISGNQIMSFMLARMKKKYSNFKTKVSELPENIK